METVTRTLLLLLSVLLLNSCGREPAESTPAAIETQTETEAVQTPGPVLYAAVEDLVDADGIVSVEAATETSARIPARSPPTPITPTAW